MNRFALIVLRSFGLAAVLFLLSSSPLQAQNAGGVAEWVESYRLSGDFRPFKALSVTQERSDLSSVVDKATILETNSETLNQLLTETPLTIQFTVPNAYGENFELELVKVDLLAPGFSLGTLGTNAQDNVPYSGGVHYRGIVRDNPNSLVALSVFSDGIMAMISDEGGDWQLGRLEDGSDKHILYRKNDLKAASPFSCFADDEAIAHETEEAVDDRGVGCKTVTVYFECDYKLFTDKGSNVTTASNYVTGLFNQVSTLYANENVGIAISQIYIWTSPDPYTSYGSTSAVLNAFRSTRGTNFTGNLAHFLSTRSLGGGIAYLDVICFKTYAFGVSAISASYQNVPTYSWSVEVVTHELGHNLGSWHTQSCNWPNGALDNCYPVEGSCSPGPAPSNGGTIMSYCHLTSYGINFNNGFGSVPGNHVRNKVLAASCLSSSGTAPIGLNTTNVTAASATLSWGAVSGATTYTVQYKTAVSSNWTSAGNTTSTTYNLSGLTASTAYNWQVKTDCSNYSASANFTTTGSGGGGGTCAAPTGPTTTNITVSSAKLNWLASSGATSYSVQYKLNSSSTWLSAGSTTGTSYNLNSLNAGTAYNWRVKANCSTGYSTSMTFSTLAGGGGGNCTAPGNLLNVTVAPTSAAIKWSPVSGAASYTIQIKYASSNTWYTLGTVSVTQVTISGLQPSTAYHWRVKTNCSGYSAQKALTTPAALKEPEDEIETEALPDMSLGYFQLYPNPAADYLTVNFTEGEFSACDIVVTDLSGRVTLRQSMTEPQQTLDVSRLQAGMYVLSLMSGEKRLKSERFVKM